MVGRSSDFSPPATITPVTFNGSITPTFPNLVASSRYANVTAEFSALFDSAIPGTSITISSAEVDTTDTEGVSLYVVWNVPTAAQETIINLALGSVATSVGSNLTINYLNPVDTSVPGFSGYFGATLSFSTGDAFQISTLTVNGTVVTTQLGGFDDSDSPAIIDGQLYTSGGTGDSITANDNDELLDITSQISNGDTSLIASTSSSHVFDYINGIYVVVVGAPRGVLCNSGPDGPSFN